MSQYSSLCSRLEVSAIQCEPDQMHSVLNLFVEIVYEVLDYSFKDLMDMLTYAETGVPEKDEIVSQFIENFQKDNIRNV